MKNAKKKILGVLAGTAVLVSIYSFGFNNVETEKQQEKSMETSKDFHPFIENKENKKESNNKHITKLRENEIFIPFSLPDDDKEYRYVKEETEERVETNLSEITRLTGMEMSLIKTEWNEELSAQDVHFRSEDLTQPVYAFLWDAELYESEGRTNTPIEIRYLSAKLTEELPKGLEVNLTSNLDFKHMYQFLFLEPEGWDELRGDEGRLDILVNVTDKKYGTTKAMSDVKSLIKRHQLAQEGISITFSTYDEMQHVWDNKEQVFK